MDPIRFRGIFNRFLARRYRVTGLKGDKQTHPLKNRHAIRKRNGAATGINLSTQDTVIVFRPSESAHADRAFRTQLSELRNVSHCFLRRESFPVRCIEGTGEQGCKRLAVLIEVTRHDRVTEMVIPAAGQLGNFCFYGLNVGTRCIFRQIDLKQHTDERRTLETRLERTEATFPGLL